MWNRRESCKRGLNIPSALRPTLAIQIVRLNAPISGPRRNPVATDQRLKFPHERTGQQIVLAKRSTSAFISSRMAASLTLKEGKDALPERTGLRQFRSECPLRTTRGVASFKRERSEITMAESDSDGRTRNGASRARPQVQGLPCKTAMPGRKRRPLDRGSESKIELESKARKWQMRSGPSESAGRALKQNWRSSPRSRRS